eukprot:150460_1
MTTNSEQKQPELSGNKRSRENSSATTDDVPSAKKQKIEPSLENKIKELKSLQMEKVKKLKQLQVQMRQVQQKYDTMIKKTRQEVDKLMKDEENKNNCSYCRACMRKTDKIVKCVICKIGICKKCTGSRCEGEECDIVSCNKKQCKNKAFEKQKCGAMLCGLGASSNPCCYYHVKQCSCPKSQW